MPLFFLLSFDISELFLRQFVGLVSANAYVILTTDIITKMYTVNDQKRDDN